MKKDKNVRKIIKYIILISIIILLGGLIGISQKEKINQIIPKNNQVEPAFTDFHLLIPKLNLSAPVIADVPGDNKEAYFKALEGGVAHYLNTKKPGEGGNIFIFGHSSYYLWAAGDYKNIFAQLDQVKEGDEIILWWQSKEYKYKVTETKLVEPTDTSVLEPTPSEQVTIMTCYPVGTTKQRLIVIAKPS